MTARERRRSRRDAARDLRPAYYVAPYRRPNAEIHPSEAFAWDQSEAWITSAEWLAWLRRSGRPYLVFRTLPGCRRWAPKSRPCISAHWYPASTRRLGWLPDSKHGRRMKAFAERASAKPAPTTTNPLP
ncbi:hypothetical protein C0214_13820 [Methylobacterium sp. DM1]|nr:hypothetical protein C0214_13820 [Methylobacterium sp. DM1]